MIEVELPGPRDFNNNLLPHVELAAEINDNNLNALLDTKGYVSQCSRRFADNQRNWSRPPCLCCAMETDTEETAVKAAGRTIRLRIFRDANGRMNRSLIDAGGSMLIVSQFTLGADTKKGNRPGFSQVPGPEQGSRLYDRFVAEARLHCRDVRTGEFGAEMSVNLTMTDLLRFGSTSIDTSHTDLCPRSWFQRIG